MMAFLATMCFAPVGLLALIVFSRITEGRDGLQLSTGMELFVALGIFLMFWLVPEPEEFHRAGGVTGVAVASALVLALPQRVEWIVPPGLVRVGWIVLGITAALAALVV